jgi:alkylation response protein AidB-like acyl-CoA dehydrogenase
MENQLEPITAAGVRFVELAEQHAIEVALDANERDRESRFPLEAFDAMKASGFMNATVPEEFGGLGLDSTHDLAVGLSRLGRGDGSVAIAANMHLVFPLLMNWLRRSSADTGDTATAEALGGLLGVLGAGTIAMANQTEGGTDLAHPLLEATPAEGGWVLNGRKIFGTLSELADVFLVGAKVNHDDGTVAAGNAFVFRGSAGQEIKGDWDAMGMRASGSHAIEYRDCFVPDTLFFERGSWGERSEFGTVLIVGANLGLLGPFLGIAEAARDAVVAMAKTRTKMPSNRPIAERPGIQLLVAEMDSDLLVCRSVLTRVAQLIDRVIGGPTTEATMDVLDVVNHQFQCAKLVINRKAIDIVDRALTISGGAGYMTANPLSRLYRDVRAGPFMQPYSPNEAWEFIGRVALGLDPEPTT